MLTHITSASRVEAPWSDVEKVEVFCDLLTISHGGPLPFLVPRGGFTDPVQYHATVDHLQVHTGRSAPH